MAKSLPWELIADILSRLAVKDLLRYRCVSKSWCSLIDGPDFINLHLNQSLKTTSHHRVVFGGRRLRDLYWVDLNALDSAVLLPYPTELGREIQVLGGCHGLLALANEGGNMAIWNPSTRRYRTFPLFEHEFFFPSDFFGFVMSGFGYDPVNDDHKLLRKINLYDKELLGLGSYSEVAIYSVKAKTWKKIDDFPDDFNYRGGCGVLVGNTVHWVISRKSDPNLHSIFAFDLVAEDHRELAVPDDKDVNNNSFIQLVNLGGCLCVAVLCGHNSDSNKSDQVDVWMMKEYGVQESWSKLFSVVPSKVTGPFCYVTPVAYLKGGDQVLLDQDGKKFLLYDVKRKRAKKVKASSFPRSFDTHVCVGSLVRIDGDDGESTRKQVGKNQNDKGKKQRTKKRDGFLSEGFRLVL